MLDQKGDWLEAERRIPFTRMEVAFIGMLFLLTLSIYSLNLTKSVLTPDGAGYPLVAERLLPGWMDGKPAYIWTGRVVFEFWQIFEGSREALIKTFAFYSALFGALTAVNVYLIFRALFRREYLGGMVSLMVAFSPMFFYSAVTIEVYTFNVFWVTLTVLFWLRRRFVLWGVAWGLAISSHITSVFLFFPFIWSVSFHDYRGQWKRVVLGSSFAISIVAVCYGWVLSFYSSVPGYIDFYRSVSQDEYLHWPTLSWGIQNVIKFKALLGFYTLISGGLLFYFRTRWRVLLPGLIVFPLLTGYFLFYRSSFFLMSKSCGFVVSILSLGAALLLCRREDKRRQLGFLILWAAPYAVFFLGWIQDGGQFYIYVIPQVALIVGALFDHLIERGRLSIGDRRRSFLSALPGVKGSSPIVAFLFILALSGGLIQEVGTIRWLHNELSHPDQYGLEIKKQVPSGGVLIAGWEAPIAKFYGPDIELLSFPFVGKPLDILTFSIDTSVRRSLDAGVSVYVTKNWLLNSGDARIVSARETILKDFTIVKVSNDVYRIVRRE
jgi:hypothetical protein